MSSVATTILGAFQAGVGRAPLQVPRTFGSAKAYTIASLVDAGQLVVGLASSPEDAERLHRDVCFFLGVREEEASQHGLLLFPGGEPSPYDAVSIDFGVVAEKINVLYKLSREPHALRALTLPIQALHRKVSPPTLFDAFCEYLVPHETLDRQRLVTKLVEAGYNSVHAVEDVGTFSARGGILDVYSPYASRPVRVDLFGDEIESIRAFEPQTQRTERDLEDIVLLPVRELIMNPQSIRRALLGIDALAEESAVPSRQVRRIQEDIHNRIHFFGIERFLPLFHEGGLVSLGSYLPRGHAVVYAGASREDVHDAWQDTQRDAAADFERAKEAHQLVLPPDAYFVDGEHLFEGVVGESRFVEMPATPIVSQQEKNDRAIDLHFDATHEIRGEILRATRQGDDADFLAPLTDRLKRWKKEGQMTVIVAGTRGQAERLLGLLGPRGMTIAFHRPETQKHPFSFFEQGAGGVPRSEHVHAHMVLGELSSGLTCKQANLCVVLEEDVFGQRVKPRRRRHRQPTGGMISGLADLRPGDFVVHVDYGIGKYHGIVRLVLGGVDGDYLSIEYRDQDKLYLPIYRLNLIQKYASAEDGRNPVLSKLGSTAWSGTKAKVKDTLLKMAAELLRLYAARASLEGFAIPGPDDRFATFEGEFPYEPTPDQQKAIDAVVQDLQKPQPMDRLICGDVGYGKTEVAMRAAMLTVLGKKQVAVLVPTTVLAAQHYQVFSERFCNTPARIGLLSRFLTPEETKRTVADLRTGRLDIVIGTHRLLSQDIEFTDLGLLVIDEEHRFGVRHKEQLKKYRTKVHVLAMSATPIPRTMHMGMMGVRDFSVIATPPVDRLPVRTEVHRFSEEVIRSAILDELRRGGQCFVVYNRVATIDAFCRMLEKLVPEARIVVGHGQMDEERLEKVMVDFTNKEFNVLLCTTIIESGIDISNANTIIIHRADKLGLAQLYQLRGRVGRSRARGRALFMIPPGNISPEGMKRLAVFERFSELGSGFKVATHDLEIRGAGNILGKEQSGAVASVGFEMYQALLSEAIEDMKGRGHQALKEPEIQMPVLALIPDHYVREPQDRLRYYQRFNRAESDEETFNLFQEVVDVFGSPPAEVENLVHLMLVKQRLARLGALSLDFAAKGKSDGPRFVVRFDAEDSRLSPEELVAWIGKDSLRRRLVPDGRLVVAIDPADDARELIQRAKDLLDGLLLAKGSMAASKGRRSVIVEGGAGRQTSSDLPFSNARKP